MATLERNQDIASDSVKGNRYYSGPRSDHFDGTVFFNPGGEAPRGLADVLRWQFREKRVRWPRSFESPFPQARPDRSVEGDGLRVTMVGHATMLIQTCGLNILTDPVWSERASPLAFAGPKRVNPPGVELCRLPPIDLVLLSHNHYDHMDLGSLKCIRAMHDPHVVTPLGNDALLYEADPTMHVTTLDWGGSAPVGNNVRVHAAPAHHWSARGLNDRRMALWAAFVVETPHGRIYHVGDTGFHGGRNYEAAAAAFGGFRLAILPIGSYEPRWFMHPHHQNPDEAAQGMKLCRAASAVGHHWGTFHLANEPVDEPPRLLAEAAARHGIAPDRFRALHPGESWDVPPGQTPGAGTGAKEAAGSAADG